MEIPEYYNWIQQTILKGGFPNFKFYEKSFKIYSFTVLRNEKVFEKINSSQPIDNQIVLNKLFKILKKINSCYNYFKISINDSASTEIKAVGAVSDTNDALNLVWHLLDLDIREQYGDIFVVLQDTNQEWLLKFVLDPKLFQVTIKMYGSTECIDFVKDKWRDL